LNFNRSGASLRGAFVAFGRLVRPVNCLMMGFAALVGELITLKGSLPMMQSYLLPSILGFCTAFTLTGGSMAINDYFDRYVDAVNEPGRPIPSGLVKPKQALYLSATLGSAGLASALLTGFYVSSSYALLVAVLSFALSSYYNAEGKRFGLLGNLMVSCCVAVPFIYGAFMVGVLPSLLLSVFALMAFLSNTGREIVKGIADVEGDKLRKVETLAIKLGPEEASQIAGLFYVLAVTLSVIPVLSAMASLWYLPFVVVADVGFLLTAAWIISNPSTGTARRMKKASLLWMFMGLLAFVFGATLPTP